MLEPRKLMPFSIEYCNAPIAVMTEITEKTPKVMPSIVSAERSLFAPRDDHAILMISPNSMALKSGVTEWWSNGVMPEQLHSHTHYSSTPLLQYSYSYLSAVTGSRRDAVQAGAKPENKPVIIETIMITRTRTSEK